MITPKNFAELLEKLGFTSKGNIFDENSLIYEKHFSGFDVFLQADVKRQKLIYPAAIGGRDRNDFYDDSHRENLVVFECVHRLLAKGYRPEHIELEKAWHLGHEAKSGRADICVVDDKGKMLIIIECKTFGREYDGERRKMEIDGGQLFSYWQQEKSCRFLTLYASDFKDGEIIYTADSVACNDDKNIEEAAKKNDSIALYRNAHSAAELFAVWNETYDKRFCGDVVFRDDTKAYDIGIKPLRKADLKDFGENNKVVNRFEEILRHNNVSDKENAFNRLVALFICKLYDEMIKGEQDEVEVQYKIGTDTYETLQDRLQRLHKDGMEVFMEEKIFYVPDDYAEKVITDYTGQNREQLIADIKKHLRILKFYTNNDFAFKDVHNEELFYQNGKILVEVVELFENYRLIGSTDLQTLGDLFEQLLNKGFKQNEGQFFTPVPITRFIWDSLPLAAIMRTQKEIRFPKIIDYACGAGHFLTQGAEAVGDFCRAHGHGGNDYWVKDCLFGVEKDYRLARVSKISLFMHGVGKGNIIFGDGLENYVDKKIAPESFDILVANPPYAVSAFKPHLKLKNNTFAILDKISSGGSEIETLFVERIAQLLRPRGVAAVILPSSILNKENESFIAARESLLKNFYIRAIAQFGSKTFGATGTNTIIAFLQKFDEPPKRAKIVLDTATAIMEGRDLSLWRDHEIFAAYLPKIGVSFDDYQNFLRRSVDYDAWGNVPYFAAYAAAFVNSPECVNKRRQASFIAAGVAENMKWLNDHFYDYAHKKEREKLIYFSLCYGQRTLIISAPSDNKGQEEFLGYTWSNRKGQEGIQIKREGGVMYAPDDREAENTLAALVRDSFIGEQAEIDELAEYYYYLPLTDMLNFGGAEFNKTIKTTKTRNETVKPGMTAYKLNGSDFSLSIGDRVLSSEIEEDGAYPVYSANVFEPFGRTNKRNLDDFSKPSIIWGIDGDWMVNYIPADQPFYPTDHCGVLRVNNNDIEPKYLAVALRVEGEYEKFSRSNRASIQRIKNLTVQVPPLDVQRQIVAEFAALDGEIAEQDAIMQKCDDDVRAKFVEMFGDIEPENSLINIVDEIIQGTSPKSEFYNETENGLPFYQGKKDFGDVYLNKSTIWTTEAVKISLKDDILMSVRAPVGDVNINPYEKICIGRGLTAIRCYDISKRWYVFYWLRLNNDKIIGHSGMAFASISGDEVKNIKIPLPPLSLQNKFAAFAEGQDRAKLEAKTRRDELIAKRDSLVTKYFR